MPDEPRYRYRIWQTSDGLWAWNVVWGTSYGWHHVGRATGCLTDHAAETEANSAIEEDQDRFLDIAAEQAAEWHEIP